MEWNYGYEDFTYDIYKSWFDLELTAAQLSIIDHTRRTISNS